MQQAQPSRAHWLTLPTLQLNNEIDAPEIVVEIDFEPKTV